MTRGNKVNGVTLYVSQILIKNGVVHSSDVIIVQEERNGFPATSEMVAGKSTPLHYKMLLFVYLRVAHSTFGSANRLSTTQWS